jgi:hypothetical protein
MKSKIEVQAEAKKIHIAQIKASKVRRRLKSISDLDRPAPTKIEKPTILIVCEGKNTEPSYFKQFKLATATIKAVGNGKNTISLVRQAILLNKKGKYERVWCVFDKDNFTANNFNNAINLAIANNFGTAYSNQAFEYWLLLHFEDHQGGAMDRSEYGSTLNKYINPLGASYEYNTSKIVSGEFFEILMSIEEKSKKPRIDLALERSERIYNQWDHQKPSLEESTTKVFELVKELLLYL